jgi:hypothetical protein
MQTERVIFKARIKCEKCNGAGEKIRPEVYSFRKEIEGKEETERKSMRSAFYARYQYDVIDEPVQLCICCRGNGYREESVKIINAQIELIK